MFEALQDEFPRVLGQPIIVPDRVATFLRPTVAGADPIQVCQIAGDNLVVGAEPPSDEDMDVLPQFALRLFELARATYHVAKVARIGRVEIAAWQLDADAAAAEMIRTGLTTLRADEAADVEVQFTRREGPHNINLKLSPASSSSEPDSTGRPVRDIIITQSDVNNWDTRKDVTEDVAQGILERGARHAREEVPLFLRQRASLVFEDEQVS
jgi:hypothetical protein